MVTWLGWAAVMVGVVSTWLAGNRRRAAWLIGAACGLLWLVVNALIGLWPGVVSSLIATAVAVRNWRKWTR